MLGISGQAKSITKRTTVDIGKEITKLPLIIPAKTNRQVTGKTPQQRTKGTKKKQIQINVAAVSSVPPAACTNVSILELAKVRLELPAGAVGDCGTVKVKFNHYNKSFPIHNGVLKWADIDEEYCLSFVFRGDYARNLLVSSLASEVMLLSEVPTNDHDIVEGKRYAKHDEHFTYYINLADKSEYTLEVIEDPVAGIGAEGLRLNAGPLKSSELSKIQPNVSTKSTTVAMDTITAELKLMATTD